MKNSEMMKRHGLNGTGALLLTSLAALGMFGCNGNQPTHEQVQQQAAQTTVAVKQDAQQAVDATRKAAAVAEADVNDVAAGVKQGLHENSAAPADKVSLNTATRVRLATLPGISFAEAGEIVKNRPFTKKHELVSRGVLSEAEFAKVESQITVE